MFNIWKRGSDHDIKNKIEMMNNRLIPVGLGAFDRDGDTVSRILAVQPYFELKENGTISYHPLGSFDMLTPTDMPNTDPHLSSDEKDFMAKQPSPIYQIRVNKQVWHVQKTGECPSEIIEFGLDTAFYGRFRGYEPLLKSPDCVARYGLFHSRTMSREAFLDLVDALPKQCGMGEDLRTMDEAEKKPVSSAPYAATCVRWMEKQRAYNERWGRSPKTTTGYDLTDLIVSSDDLQMSDTRANAERIAAEISGDYAVGLAPIDDDRGLITLLRVSAKPMPREGYAHSWGVNIEDTQVLRMLPVSKSDSMADPIVYADHDGSECKLCVYDSVSWSSAQCYPPIERAVSTIGQMVETSTNLQACNGKTISCENAYFLMQSLGENLVRCKPKTDDTVVRNEHLGECISTAEEREQQLRDKMFERC